MNQQPLTSVLEENRKVLIQALKSFERSLAKCQSISLAQPLSFEAEESFDSLTSKFARISDVFTQKVLKSLVLLLREDAPTFVDRMNLCEKLHVIPSAEILITVRDLRNLIAHEYAAENLLEVYKETLALSGDLISAIRQADQHLDRLLHQ